MAQNKVLYTIGKGICMPIFKLFYSFVCTLNIKCYFKLFNRLIHSSKVKAYLFVFTYH